MTNFSLQGVGDISFAPDPFAPKPRGLRSSFANAILATALFRCWHILIFFGAWATAVSVITYNVHSLAIQPTLLTVIGTVLGFVISYRTTSSFERYNEGRRLWSQIILASRNFARTVWFHVPDTMPGTDKDQSEEERRARIVIEKKTVINLLEAFGVAVKHYLRGEDGIYYTDLYHLVKFLPAYALPPGIPSFGDLSEAVSPSDPSISAVMNQNGNNYSEKDEDKVPITPPQNNFPSSAISQRISHASSAPQLPFPTTTPSKKPSFLQPPPSPRHRDPKSQSQAQSNPPRTSGDREKMSMTNDDGFLLPARMPPKYHLFDLFPFSLLVRLLTKKGKEVKGKKAARMRARLKGRAVSHNLPLEISLYLSSYIAALQNRKVIDAPTSTNLLASLGLLVDALTGLERILTTPIPFSYAIHLWVVTIIYCLFLPFQIWGTLKWLTIPATVILSFIFFGFLVAGEEIENPFGYDKNDLNMDHFTQNIIRNELRAITATPAPDPAHWAFSPRNDLIFASYRVEDEERVTPEEWVTRGPARMQAALSIA